MVRLANSSNRRNAKYRCRVCKRFHALRSCRTFLQMTAEDRWKVIRANGYCVNCLAHEHSSGSCRSDRGCKRCNRPHHTLLHRTPPTPASSGHQHRRASHQATAPKKIVSVLPTAEVEVRVHGKTHKLWALIDACSTQNRVSLRTVERLKISSKTVDNEERVVLPLRARGDDSTSLSVACVVKETLGISTPKERISSSVRQHFKRIKLADRDFHKPAPVQIVLGSESIGLILKPEMKMSDGMPMAQRTIFGWILSGAFTQ